MGRTAHPRPQLRHTSPGMGADREFGGRKRRAEELRGNYAGKAGRLKKPNSIRSQIRGSPDDVFYLNIIYIIFGTLNRRFLLENVKITPANGEGKIKANITISEGRMTALFTLVENKGKYYLNNPTKFVESLKGKKFGEKAHTGFIDQAFITDLDWMERIRLEALKTLGIEE